MVQWLTESDAQALTAPFVVRYQAFAEAGAMPQTVSKGLATLPNYSKWSKAIHAEDSVTYVFDGPKIGAGMVERLKKLKVDAK